MDRTKLIKLSLENERIILKAITEEPNSDRSHLSNKTGIHRSTIFDIIVRLKNKGLVYSTNEEREGNGRRRVLYDVLKV